MTYRVRKSRAAAAALGLAIRIPAWSRHAEVLRNGKPAKPVITAGYAYLTDLRDGDTVTVTLDMRAAPRISRPRRSPTNSGMVAIMRGPLVYCAEGVDNQGDVLGLSILRSAPDRRCRRRRLAACPNSA